MSGRTLAIVGAGLGWMLLVGIAGAGAETKPGRAQKAPVAAPEEAPQPGRLQRGPVAPSGAQPGRQQVETPTERAPKPATEAPAPPPPPDAAAQRARAQKLDRSFGAAAAKAQRELQEREAAFEREQRAWLEKEAASAKAQLDKLRAEAAAARARRQPKLEVEAAVAGPRITGGFGALQSGNGVIVLGERFGENRGEVHLLTAVSSMKLEIDEWYDSGIGGFVPARAAVACLTGEVQVLTQDGKRSNKRIFGVPQTYKSLPREDVKVVRCGRDSNSYACNDISADEDCFLDYDWTFVDITGASIWGEHGNCAGAIGDDSGTDVYEISLRNGWVLDNVQVVTGFDPGEASMTPAAGQLPAGFQDGAPSWRPVITWNVTPGDRLKYALFIGIRGPECASH